MESYIPLLQTLVWPFFIAVLVICFRKQIIPSAEAIRHRIEQGGAFRAGPIELGELPRLEYRDSDGEGDQAKENPERANSPSKSREQERKKIYAENRGMFITHVLAPSRHGNQKYDIFIYLIKHQRNDEQGPHDLSEVEKAEFYLGKMWRDRVFVQRPRDGLIGMSTSAYAPFLCTCDVYLKSGEVIKLSRYIDFEMANRVLRWN